jgi:preprotein translocase subunit SecG
MFRACPFCPSSGISQHCTYAIGICHSVLLASASSAEFSAASSAESSAASSAESSAASRAASSAASHPLAFFYFVIIY